MTKVRLNTCDPYMIRYPIPSLETKNSPIITPIIDIWRKLINKEFLFNNLQSLEKLNDKS